MWNAQFSQDSTQIKLVFEDMNDGTAATITLVVDGSGSTLSASTENYQSYDNVDAFLTAIGTESQLDFV